MNTIFLPRYTMKEDCCISFKDIFSTKKRIAIFYGEKAWAASNNKVMAGLKSAEAIVVEKACYGQDATYENVEKCLSLLNGKEVDFLLAVGGGKCIDTIKVVADKIRKPIYTLATIASTCAAVTKISIMYNSNGSFKDIYALSQPPVHCFIDPTIILEAPVKYLWAGIGDTMAKHVESAFSARNDNLDYASELGIKIGENCFYPILRDGYQALKDAKLKIVSEALNRTILNILITTGSVSVSVDPKYNSALAHAMFYGLTVRKKIEENHLHGEVVSYGTLVQLIMDNDIEKLKLAYKFYTKVGLPVCLNDLELSIGDNLDDILIATEINKELEHVPYPVTKSKIFAAMEALETFRLDVE